MRQVGLDPDVGVRGERDVEARLVELELEARTAERDARSTLLELVRAALAAPEHELDVAPVSAARDYLCSLIGTELEPSARFRLLSGRAPRDQPDPGPIVCACFEVGRNPIAATIEAGRNLGASRLRALIELVIPQVSRTLFVGLVLSFVTMMSVLSVPMMVAGSQPTMMTVDMAFRITSYGDYGVANALGVISYLITAFAAWFYLRHNLSERGQA